MILDKTVKIKITNRNIRYYIEKGYNAELNSIMDISIQDLPKNSKIKINVQCDVCGEKNKKLPEFKSYYKSTNGLTTTYHCSKCKSKKAKNTLIEKYGVNNSYQIEEVKEKAKKSVLEKYGVEYPMLSKKVHEKIAKTWRNKWGTEHPFLNDIFKENLKKENNKKWNVDYLINKESVKEKTKNISQNKLFNDYNEYLTKEYGNEYKILNVYKDENDTVFDLYHNKCGHSEKIKRNTLYDRIKDNSSELCIHCNPFNSRGSSHEKNLREWVKEVCDDNIEIVINSREIIDGKELDIFIPKYNLAIEFNGVYWHNEKFVDKNYHLEKTLDCNKKGIQLLHIFEDDWIFKKDICKSIILNKLGKNKETIYARKCVVKEVKTPIVRNFLDENHIQGFSRSTFKLGLYYEGYLVSIMTFGYRKTNAKKEFELVRFCNRLNTNVIGASSKLFKYFIKNYNIEEKYILSYADISLFDGKMYDMLGFKNIHLTKPNYFWVVDNIRKHRWRYNKHNLIKEGFDGSKTEVQIMHERGYYRIWGCGQVRYEYWL